MSHKCIYLKVCKKTYFKFYAHCRISSKHIETISLSIIYCTVYIRTFLLILIHPVVSDNENL